MRSAALEPIDRLGLFLAGGLGLCGWRGSGRGAVRRPGLPRMPLSMATVSMVSVAIGGSPAPSAGCPGCCARPPPPVGSHARSAAGRGPAAGPRMRAHVGSQLCGLDRS